MWAPSNTNSFTHSCSRHRFFAFSQELENIRGEDPLFPTLSMSSRELIGKLQKAQ
uniref:Uncharacterized protein n=1 Tax=Haemonchus contortus TaxID=6289 RepID=A0A7I4YR19_HAECO